jgi:hypothetical protein
VLFSWAAYYAGRTGKRQLQLIDHRHQSAGAIRQGERQDERIKISAPAAKTKNTFRKKHKKSAISPVCRPCIHGWLTECPSRRAQLRGHLNLNLNPNLLVENGLRFPPADPFSLHSPTLRSSDGTAARCLRLLAAFIWLNRAPFPVLGISKCQQQLPFHLSW